MCILRTSTRTLLTPILLGIFAITSAAAGAGGITGKVTLEGQLPTINREWNKAQAPGSPSSATSIPGCTATSWC